MICPSDLVQMHQKDKLGAGYSADEEYKTAEVKECPQCKRLVVEAYMVKQVTSMEEGSALIAKFIL